VAMMLLSAGTMGIAIHFLILFPSSFHGSFDTFAVVAPALTIILLIIIMLRSTPSWDCISLFILAIFWLTMGAWSTDVIGGVQCESLTGQQTPTKKGQISTQSWCREMKVVEAFSWANFGILALSVIIIISLVVRLFSMGTQGVWAQPVSELDWFGNPYAGLMGSGTLGAQGLGVGAGTGAYNGSQVSAMGLGNAGVPPAMTNTQPLQQAAGGVQYVKQVPGHSVVINGSGIPGAAAVQQVPSTGRHHRGRSHSISSSRRS